MGLLLAKQPNGKYCLYSTVVDSFASINLTYEGLIEALMEYRGFSREKAIYEAEYYFHTIRPYEDLKGECKQEDKEALFTEMETATTEDEHKAILLEELRARYRNLSSFPPTSNYYYGAQTMLSILSKECKDLGIDYNQIIN